ncbi:hypothetical protein K0M31_012819 [Melipona bicolor]|uniref:Reverse transcriptase Ty1/copia-type domain-containing protein n=1 Tax=Melipona bicolor TaxID=60889 RepID=A0AA40FK32_9HYME|nr:hypothetical protein K0M31_012819 [Melipona bicolor]
MASLVCDERLSGSEIVRSNDWVRGSGSKYGSIEKEVAKDIPVGYSTIRLLLALSIQLDLDIDHLDVTTAFLNSNLKEEAYMDPPLGYENKGVSTQKMYLWSEAS